MLLVVLPVGHNIIYREVRRPVMRASHSYVRSSIYMLSHLVYAHPFVPNRRWWGERHNQGAWVKLCCITSFSFNNYRKSCLAPGRVRA